MKNIFSFLLILLFAVAFSFGANSTATLTKVDETANSVSYQTSFTKGTTDTIYVDFLAAGVTFADYNDQKLTLRLSSTETTADSVRWSILVQAVAYPADTWFTVHTFVDTNTVTPFINMYDPATYGYWPYIRLLVKGAGAKTAQQTVTIKAIFDRDSGLKGD